MSVDILQEKIRKAKNPAMLELAMSVSDLPEGYSSDAAGYGAYCRALLEGLKGLIPSVRVSFSAFALLGPDGVGQLTEILKLASDLGYYVALDAPEMLSPMMAKLTAETIFGENSLYPCDGLVIGSYLGSDVIKPFLNACKKEKKDVFVVARTANKSAPELQDLLSGSRLVHAAAADYVNRCGGGTEGKMGYKQLGLLVSATAADSLRSLRGKYPGVFFLVDGYDYPGANAKNCANAFDKYGHGAAVCAGSSILSFRISK